MPQHLFSWRLKEIKFSKRCVMFGYVCSSRNPVLLNLTGSLIKIFSHFFLFFSFSFLYPSFRPILLFFSFLRSLFPFYFLLFFSLYLLFPYSLFHVPFHSFFSFTFFTLVLSLSFFPSFFYYFLALYLSICLCLLPLFVPSLFLSIFNTRSSFSSPFWCFLAMFISVFLFILPFRYFGPSFFLSAFPCSCCLYSVYPSFLLSLLQSLYPFSFFVSTFIVFLSVWDTESSLEQRQPLQLQWTHVPLGHCATFIDEVEQCTLIQPCWWMALVLLRSVEYSVSKCGSHFHNVHPRSGYNIRSVNLNELTKSLWKSSTLQSFFIKYVTCTSIFET